MYLKIGKIELGKPPTAVEIPKVDKLNEKIPTQTPTPKPKRAVNRVKDFMMVFALVIVFNILFLVNLFWMSNSIFSIYVPPFNNLMALMTMVIFGMAMAMAWPYLNARIHGNRFKYWVELDTGRQGWVLLDEDLKQAKITGLIRSINLENSHHGILYLYHKLAENVHVEYDNTKAKFYQNSNEFDTLMKNNMLAKLIITKAEKLIEVIMYICIINLAAIAYVIYKLFRMG
jgi:hypothetical protein